MDKIKLSALSKDDVVLVEGRSQVNNVEDILSDLESYKDAEIYTTTVIHANFNAKEIMESVIEDQLNNGMYEDWDDSIWGDITDEDIKELQVIFDRILARSPSCNIAYESDKLIEIDMSVYCPTCGPTGYKNVEGKPVCVKCGRVATEEEIAADIRKRFEELKKG